MSVVDVLREKAKSLLNTNVVVVTKQFKTIAGELSEVTDEYIALKKPCIFSSLMFGTGIEMNLPEKPNIEFSMQILYPFSENVGTVYFSFDEICGIEDNKYAAF